MKKFKTENQYGSILLLQHTELYNKKKQQEKKKKKNCFLISMRYIDLV